MLLIVSDPVGVQEQTDSNSCTTIVGLCVLFWVGAGSALCYDGWGIVVPVGGFALTAAIASCAAHCCAPIRMGVHGTAQALATREALGVCACFSIFASFLFAATGVLTFAVFGGQFNVLLLTFTTMAPVCLLLLCLLFAQCVGMLQGRQTHQQTTQSTQAPEANTHAQTQTVPPVTIRVDQPQRPTATCTVSDSGSAERTATTAQPRPEASATCTDNARTVVWHL